MLKISVGRQGYKPEGGGQIYINESLGIMVDDKKHMIE